MPSNHPHPSLFASTNRILPGTKLTFDDVFEPFEAFAPQKANLPLDRAFN
jgi:hypothetical protein